MKGFSLLLFCGHYLSPQHLSTHLTQTPIWPLIMVISLVETSQVFAQPLIFSVVELSSSLPFTIENEPRSNTRFLTPLAGMLLVSTAFTRAAIHFFLCWLFIFSWQTNNKIAALDVALIHGIINIVMLQVANHSHSPSDHISKIGAAYLIIAVALSIIVSYMRYQSGIALSLGTQQQTN